MSIDLRPPTGRRNFLKTAATALAVPAAASLVGGALPGIAHADTPALPDFAPIPSGAFGPGLNSDGYHVGRIAGDLYWVTDSYYQAMFLTTPRGVVLVDAPPTIGHNLIRAMLHHGPLVRLASGARQKISCSGPLARGLPGSPSRSAVVRAVADQGGRRYRGA